MEPHFARDLCVCVCVKSEVNGHGEVYSIVGLTKFFVWQMENLLTHRQRKAADAASAASEELSFSSSSSGSGTNMMHKLLHGLRNSRWGKLCKHPWHVLPIMRLTHTERETHTHTVCIAGLATGCVVTPTKYYQGCKSH